MESRNNILVITDVKWDDIFAIVILYNYLYEHVEEQSHITFLITAVNNQEGAAAFTNMVLKSYIKHNMLDIVPSFGFVKGNQSDEPKSHETSLYVECRKNMTTGRYELYKKKDQRGNFVTQPLKSSHIVWDTIPDNAVFDEVYAFAPCSDYYHFLENSIHSHISLGYNTGDAKFDQLDKLTGTVFMNNIAEAINSDRKEKGRFYAPVPGKYKQDDCVWEALFNKAPILEPYLYFSARTDSIKFIARQLTKFNDYYKNGKQKKDKDDKLIFDKYGNKVWKYEPHGTYIRDNDGTVYCLTAENIENDLENNVFSNEVKTMTTLLKTAFPKETYLRRVLDQLIEGVIHVECTDAQHIVLWLGKGWNYKPASLKEGKYFIEIERTDDGHQYIPTLVTKEIIRDKVCEYLK